jgi:hypothetical protein
MTRAHLIATLAATLEAADRSAAHFVGSADVYVTRAAELLHEAEALCAGDRAADARAETDTARLDAFADLLRECGQIDVVEDEEDGSVVLKLWETQFVKYRAATGADVRGAIDHAMGATAKTEDAR